jgi:aminoglycoside phosphotransferase (APT) family kinase protein
VCAARGATVERLRLLTGGASRQTWSFDAVIEDAGGHRRTLPLILRSDLTPATSFMAQDVECRLLRAAREAGVPAPRVHHVGDDSLGHPFFIMERIAGETIPRRLLRDAVYAGARDGMTAQLGAILARVHRIPIETDGLDQLLPAPPPDTAPAIAECARVEQLFRAVTPDPHPVFELAFRWLGHHALVSPEAAAPPPRALVHGDFRMGNLIVGPEGVRAVLDWELAHIGDPTEDLAWLCVRSWRFGNDDLPVAGVGKREALWHAYEMAGGVAVDPARAHFWEVFGNLRWGIICIVQARRHLDGHSASVELASIGRRVAETEWELLTLMDSAP